MAKQTWNNPIDKNVDWGGDASTDGLPVSGQQVQKFIKDSLDKKASIFYRDVANNRYLVFADEETKNAYVDDPTRVDLILGNFDAPFNYTAEINLATSAYNAIYLGETGNYIDFTFDIKNKQDVSTMENVVITYTIMRNAAKQVFSQIAKHGDIIHTNIDKYLGEGINTIIIGISGQTSLAATTVAVTYNVVNLQIEDETDITIAYDLSSNSKILETGVTVKGTGIKTVEWYLDGQKLDFVKNEDEIVEAEGYRPKNIELANLQQGRHSLQVRACTNINGDLFYTPTLYRDIIVYTGADNNTITAISMEIPSKYGIITESPILYGLTQYIPYSLKFATYSPTNKEKVSVAISLDGARLGIVDSKNGIINEFTVVSKTAGSKTLILAEEASEYAIPMVVEATSMKIEEITSGLALDFYSVGMNGNAWSFGDYTGTFSGFNWNATSGWVDNRLRINAGASFSIDYAPLAGKPTDKGKTLEFEFKTTNVNDDNAIICDLRNSNGTGLLITATKITLTSENGVVLQNEFKASEEVRIAIVINRSTASTRKCLSLFYANGSVSRCNNWDVTDGYESDAQITFVGSSGAEVELKAIRIYDLALTDDQILNNYTLYRDNVSEMLDVYERNDIYAEGSTSFSPDKMVSRLPVMIVTGDIPTLENTSDKDTQIIVDIEYTNLQEPSRSFKMTGAAMRPQGTSSMGYPKKNFRIYTKKVEDTILYDSNGSIVSDKLYSFKEGAIPVDCWCLKADYAESSGTHNTGIARMWNKALYNMQIDGQYVCRTDAQKAALASGYPYDVRTTIDGFPILLFYRQSASDEPIFIGKYNFNNDKSTEKVFGFTDIEGFNNERMQCWEVLNNGNPIGLFTDVSDFYNNVTVDGETKKGWEFAFESRYPDTKTPATDDLYNFATWLNGVNGDAERFAIEKWEHFKVYPLAAYYCYIMRHAAADQLVKNAMLTSEDGTHFYFIQYDNDTINGLINTGVIDILPTDNRESKNASGEYKFAGHSSVLWNMLEADTEFMQIVKNVDNALYSAGVSYNECVRIFDEEQANKWVERVYNQDAEYKYVSPYVNAGINNLDMLQGKRDLHRRWWLSKRFSIYDAKFVSGEYKSQAIELKCMNDTPAGQQFSIKAGYPLDYGYGINNLPRETGVTLDAGETKEFTTAEVVNRGDPIRIYGAPNIAEVDLSKIANRLAIVNITSVNTPALGTRLEKLILGGEGVNNAEVSEISGLKQATKLKYLDVRGLRGINSIDLSSHPSFEELKAIGSEVTAVTLTKGAPVNRLELPATMKVLNLEQLPYLTAENLVLENIANIHTISIKNCPKLSNSFDWVKDWYNSKVTADDKSSFTMDNILWKDVNPDDLIMIKGLGTLNLKGKVELSEISLEHLNALIEVYGESAFDPDADFYIDAPPAVFVTGRTELLEGESEKYSVIVFGAEVRRITYGGSSYVTVSEDGTLSTTEGIGNKIITLRVSIITSAETITRNIEINIRARTYPSQSQTSIAGANRLEKTKETYTLAYSVEGITGDMIAEWTLTGMDDFVVIDSYTDNSCVLKTLKQATSMRGSLSCKLTKRYNNQSLFTVSRDIFLVDDTIAETDPGICQALYDAGLTASPTAVTKDEAKLITGSDLQRGTSYVNSVFYPQRANIKSFDGFKYFTGVALLLRYTFYGLNKLESIHFPDNLEIQSYALYNCGSNSAPVNIYLGNNNKGESASTPPALETFCNIIYGINNANLVPYLALHSHVYLKSITLPDCYNSVELLPFDQNMISSVSDTNANFKVYSKYIAFVSAQPKAYGVYKNLRFGDKLYEKKFGAFCLKENVSQFVVELPEGAYMQNMETTKAFNGEEVVEGFYADYTSDAVFFTLRLSNNAGITTGFSAVYTGLDDKQITVELNAGDNIIPCARDSAIKSLTIQLIVPDTVGFVLASSTDITVRCESPILEASLLFYPESSIYIQHIDGSLYTTSEWSSNGFANEVANGVAIVTQESSFVVSKSFNSSTKAYGTQYGLPKEIAIPNKMDAILDYEGIRNTEEIVKLDTHKTSAAYYCTQVKFPNGKMGYLPALGQLWLINGNKSEINAALNLIGGAQISGDLWSSTPNNISKLWFVNFDTSNIASSIGNTSAGNTRWGYISVTSLS